ncbi:MAG: acyl-CoA dehydrogenase family protein, partial [Candidatus Hydrogenedentes bacterium]|nr:acyl-CoA dehydrogenase family protein [Candidatus Hydrogenedentota bacterium]
MTLPTVRRSSEQEARALAESTREKNWRKPSFMKQLFLGDFRFDMICHFPRLGQPDRPEYIDFLEHLKKYLLDEIDPEEVDRTGEFPGDVVERLAALGALGMNIPREYGGQGFSKSEYCRTMVLSGSHEGSLMGFLSPHQSVGVPECLKLFGTEAQKQKYLPRCAQGDISAFALTEADVGSDPARLSTSVELTPGGATYLLNGVKLWCTNGTVAKLLVVMARHKETSKISA